jgi:hypothetical protein
MRIAFVASDIPNREHGTVTYSSLLLLQGLRERGHDVSTILLLPSRSAFGDDATRARWLSELAESGHQAVVVPADVPPPSYGRVGRLRRLAVPFAEDAFPHHGLHPLVEHELARARPDATLVYLGFDALAATDGSRAAPRFAFMGDPAHLPPRHRRRFEGIERRGIAEWLWRIENRHHRRAVMGLLRRSDAAAVNAAHHAAELRRDGLTHVRYLQTPIDDWGGPEWAREKTELESKGPLRIALMGHLRGTATLTGLAFLADRVLPALDERKGSNGYEVHVCGSGSLPAGLAQRLDHPAVRLRGFVPDVVRELRQSHVFLVPTPIDLGARVRIASAWSCGACIVAHTANSRGIGELEHGRNGLLGDSGPALAEQIVRAYDDPELRARLAAGGRATYESSYAPAATVPRVEAILEEIAA